MVGVGLAVGLAAAAATGFLVHRWGVRMGFVDRPDDLLKTHSGNPVPLGGVALMVGVHSGMAAAGVFEVGLFIATTVVFAVGLVDDWKGLTPIVRLVAAAAGGIVLALFDSELSGGLAILATIGLVILTVNAINLLDGLDALAAGVSTVAFIGLGVFIAIQGGPEPWVLLIPAAALVGFLVWNVPPARLYLGDNGAYVVGVLLVWAVLRAGSDWPSSLVAVALIGVPFIDLVVTIARRLRSGHHLFAGDRDHTYDGLHSRGVGTGSVALTFAAAQALWAIMLIGTAVLAGDVTAVALASVVGIFAVVVAIR